MRQQQVQRRRQRPAGPDDPDEVPGVVANEVSAAAERWLAANDGS